MTLRLGIPLAIAALLFGGSAASAEQTTPARADAQRRFARRSARGAAVRGHLLVLPAAARKDIIDTDESRTTAWIVQP